MKLLLKLAFRNVSRNFRRSLLTFLAISLGIGLGIIFIGFAIGAERQSIKLSVDTYSGHLKVHDKGYIEEDLTINLDFTISDYSDALQKISGLDGVSALTERIFFPSSITDGIEELNLTGVGINIEHENAVFKLDTKLLDGEFIKPGEERMLLPDKLADLFSVSAGDFLTVIARTKYGAINAFDLEIAGIIHVGNLEVDNQCFFIPLGLAQEFLEMENMVTEITVMGSSMETASALAKNIGEVLDSGRYDIVTWEYMSRDLIRLYKIRGRARMLIIFIMLLMASASVMNTMLMSIFERTSEIGTIMAMGLRKWKIILLFIFEGMFLGIFGSFVGSLIGGGVTYYFKFNGIDISSFGQDFGNLPLGQYIYTEITPTYLISMFLLGVFIAVLSAAYPAMRGAKLQPADALRYV